MSNDFASCQGFCPGRVRLRFRGGVGVVRRGSMGQGQPVADQLIKSVAEIFQNFTFHLGVGAWAGRWGEKASLAWERAPGADNWLLSALQNEAGAGRWVEGVACFYRGFFCAA